MDVSDGDLGLQQSTVTSDSLRASTNVAHRDRQRLERRSKLAPNKLVEK